MGNAKYEHNASPPIRQHEMSSIEGKFRELTFEAAGSSDGETAFLSPARLSHDGNRRSPLWLGIKSRTGPQDLPFLVRADLKRVPFSVPGISGKTEGVAHRAP